MMKRFIHKCFSSAVVLIFILLSCDDEKVSDLPTSVQLFYSLVGRQAAFMALPNSVSSYAWDFGDGQTSTEKDPVHVYSSGGYYRVIVKVEGKTGTDADTVELAVDLTPYVLLTGGPTRNGKTWKLDSSHPKDKFALADGSFTNVQALSSGLLGSIGYSAAYDDSFTFYFDGKYSIEANGAPSSDNAAFGGYVNALYTGATVVKFIKGISDVYDLCTVAYPPQSGLTFTYTAKEDFAVSSVANVTYPGVSTLSFSGKGYIGFFDAQRKVIIQEITDKSMRLVIFIAASPGAYPKASHALVLTFKAV